MTRWYRAYDGTVTDDKLAETSLIANTSRSVVIATWHAILESCARTQDGGRFETTARRIAAALGEPVTLIENVFAGLSEVEMIADDVVVAWSKRQFESDSSTERSRKHREASRNADATLQQQQATPPDTDTDTDRKKDIRAVKDRTGADFEEFWKIKPSRGKAANPKTPAMKAYQSAVRKGADPKQINGAARRWSLDEQKPGTEYVAMAVTWLNQKRFDDYKPPPDDAALRARQDDLMRSRGFEWRDDKWAKIEGEIHEKVCG